MVSVLTRVGLALLSAAVIGWSAVLLDNYRSSQQVAPDPFATERAPGISVPEALDKLRGARTLDPDSSFDLTLSAYHASTGQGPRAIAIAQAVTRDEPENKLAWVTLALAAAKTDPALATRAGARIKQLDPRGSGR